MRGSGPIRVGIMGFGQTGRQIYALACANDDIEVVAIADIGAPEILHYLLCAEADAARFKLEGNFLTDGHNRTRMIAIDRPAEVPWDIFGVDLVIDATGKYRSQADMQAHLDNGAGRVLLRTLPQDHIDRIVMPGINEAEIDAADRMISAGSGTTTALALLLNILAKEFAIECVSMTRVHAYTSDQALQDYAGSDFRRSRSAAKNIIPNGHDAAAWIGHVLPHFDGRIISSALNVPIHDGCLLDANLVFADAAITVDAVNDAMRAAAGDYPGIVAVAEDPIVSSDVIGSACSLLFDAPGTIKAGDSIIKTLGWYENLGHAARLLEVACLYGKLRHAEAA